MANRQIGPIGETGGGAPNARTRSPDKEDLGKAALTEPLLAKTPQPQDAASLSTGGGVACDPLPLDGDNALDPFAEFEAALAREKAEAAAEILSAAIEQPTRRPAPPGRRWNDRGQLVFDGSIRPQPNPKGRKGSRNKLAMSFFTDMYNLWEEQGEAILRRAAFDDPVAFAGIVAKLMPQKIEISDTTMTDIENERLERLIEFANGAIERRGLTALALETDGREGAALEVGAVEILPPLPKTA